MLQIKTQQLEAFTAQGAKAFYDRLAVDLREYISQKWPSIAQTEVDMKISHAFDLCRHYSIQSEAHITEMSYIFIAFPPEFYFDDRYAWLDQVLRSQASAETRVRQIRAVLSQQEETSR
ncbi:hypothetical protein GFB49_19330 [Epibacterium sp. SM1979]|uniref:Uncharacterized protein n=1 Tax=Tritonibacter litoralis TaxID=2662264 RepID=A0A843YIE6_9RHOB|nr:hypothetical protein [Tritonibacter litoralis]MQQ10611.1 hypothetical protein [Tritonibacter litoralis]